MSSLFSCKHWKCHRHFDSFPRRVLVVVLVVLVVAEHASSNTKKCHKRKHHTGFDSESAVSNSDGGFFATVLRTTATTTASAYNIVVNCEMNGPQNSSLLLSLRPPMLGCCEGVEIDTRELLYICVYANSVPRRRHNFRNEKSFCATTVLWRSRCS